MGKSTFISDSHIRGPVIKTCAHFQKKAINRWLSVRIDIAGALVSFFAGAFILSNIGKIDSGLAGLSLTYAITFTDNLL